MTGLDFRQEHSIGAGSSLSGVIPSLSGVPVRRRWRCPALLAVVLVAVACTRAGEARAGEALIAVATNFAEVMPPLVEEFERKSGHDLRYTTGSTGQLYAQISKRAPFDAFLAADTERPARLVAEDRAVAASRFTYARGRLVLWSRDANRIDADGAGTLRDAPPRKLAMANPRLAPYGAAARETLEHLGLWDEFEPRIAMAQNVGQAYAMVHMGAAEMGFVARSALLAKDGDAPGSHWPVPSALHDPIRQDAVLLSRSEDNAAARAFLDFLAGPHGRRIIADHGYELE